jgi:hypothetical protein
MLHRNGGRAPETRRGPAFGWNGGPSQNRSAATTTSLADNRPQGKRGPLSVPVVDGYGEPLPPDAVAWRERLVREAKLFRAGLLPRRARPGPIIAAHLGEVGAVDG